ncbi:hypothetical protein VC290_19090 [Xanthomonas campestris]|uniref:hypothetical protein n=1 Tax=Xanthomonas campestris TaxID=339 RepID=UPI002B22711F|nr:hypothetical protein [Xanthomonas campestris]MEA9482417.1 hypothetical protein [Xanthomonas campestris]
MSETLKTKAAGLDLIDRLYRNHVLVDLAFSEDERNSLRAIASQARALLIKKGLSGLELERAIHCALSCIESQVADRPEDHLVKLGIEFHLPEGMDQDGYDQAAKFSRDYATAQFLGYGSIGQEDTSVVVDVINSLVLSCANLTGALRHRLAERVFAAEFPLGTLEILTWLARNDILAPAKYRRTSNLSHSLDPVSIRAISLWEQDNIRKVIQSSVPGHDSTVLHQSISRCFAKELSEAGMIWLTDAIRTESKRARRRTARHVLHINAVRWNDSSYLRSTLKNLHTLAPCNRADVCSQSTVVSDIGASLLARAKLMDSTKALIRGDELKSTLSDEIARQVNQHGFQMSARTIYNSLKSHEVRAEKIIRCCRMMREADIAYPAEYPDFYRMFQVAMTA